jgi:DNA mismatch repair protein MutS
MRLGCKTLFATHYHELTALEHAMEGVRNYNVSVKKRGDEITFLRKIVPGGADDSYGIEVAGLAGVPDAVIRRAKAVLKELENEGAPGSARAGQAAGPDFGQLSLLDMGGSEVAAILNSTELNTLTPLEALNLLFELKKKV